MTYYEISRSLRHYYEGIITYTLINTYLDVKIISGVFEHHCTIFDSISP